MLYVVPVQFLEILFVTSETVAVVVGAYNVIGRESSRSSNGNSSSKGSCRRLLSGFNCSVMLCNAPRY